VRSLREPSKRPDYYRLTGKPLGITGEVGEYEAARLLDLNLADARAPGYDATDKFGRRYQIKARAFSEAGRRKSQHLGSIKLDHEWEAVLLVLMDESLQTLEIWEADRSAVADALTAPGSKARNERGAMAVSKFKQIGKQIWPEQVKEIERKDGADEGKPRP
jgi:hypothetical protein